MLPFLKGLLVGFSIAAPVGPIGLLCIRRALSAGRMAGFVSGLGAATADALYGVVATLGLTAVTNLLIEQQHWLRLGGGVFLLYLGVATLRAAPPAGEARARRAENGWAAYASTFVLTLTNPMTIISFVGIFAGIGVGASTSGAGAAGLLVVGVFLGSAAWWLILSTTAGWLGARLQSGGLRIVNIVSGAVIAAFGAWQLWTLVRT
jgi:threonine/homoserine/homoserine lactone efflux protein